MTRTYDIEYMMDYERKQRLERERMNRAIDEALGIVKEKPEYIGFSLNMKNKNCYKVCGNKNLNTSMIVEEKKNCFIVDYRGELIEVKFSWFKNFGKVWGFYHKTLEGGN